MWYDMIWYDLIWYDMIWYDMIWWDLIWYDMICIYIHMYPFSKTGSGLLLCSAVCLGSVSFFFFILFSAHQSLGHFGRVSFAWFFSFRFSPLGCTAPADIWPFSHWHAASGWSSFWFNLTPTSHGKWTESCTSLSGKTSQFRNDESCHETQSSRQLSQSPWSMCTCQEFRESQKLLLALQGYESSGDLSGLQESWGEVSRSRVVH